MTKSWVTLSGNDLDVKTLTIGTLRAKIRRHEIALKAGFVEEKARARRDLPELRAELERRQETTGVRIREVI